MEVTFDGDDGYACPDNKAEAWVDAQIAENNRSVSVGTDLLLMLFRLRRSEGIIPELTIVHEGQRFDVDDRGRLSDWPDGLADVPTQVLSKLVRGAIKDK